jgi:phosphomannomutase
MDNSIFKAYDIRGVYPTQINAEAVYQITQAYCKLINPKKVALGRDVRTSGPELWDAACRGLTDHGVDVVDIGVISTDMLYFAVSNYGYDGGITISASHNPAEYNGMKLTRAGAVPISGDTGIQDIRQLVEAEYEYKAPEQGQVEKLDITENYLAKCLSFVDVNKFRKFKVVANAMFGPALQNIQKMKLPLDLIMLNENLDGSFPKGQPDPMQEANRLETVQAIESHKPDFGVAWDGDADRFFLFDETGRYIPGYYLTAFFGEYFAKQHAGAKIIYDPRLTWATIDAVSRSGGVPLVNKAGHSFIKERMRKENAVFAGEMSGHYYFKDYFYCDNGLIPFLLVLEVLSEIPVEIKVSQLFDRYFELYPISGEINTKLSGLSETRSIMDKLQSKYSDAKTDMTDGLTLEYHDWRANIRSSNTEPMIRVNVEAKNEKLLAEKTEEVMGLIRG